MLREGVPSCCESRFASEIACQGLIGERRLQANAGVMGGSVPIGVVAVSCLSVSSLLTCQALE